MHKNFHCAWSQPSNPQSFPCLFQPLGSVGSVDPLSICFSTARQLLAESAKLITIVIADLLSPLVCKYLSIESSSISKQ